MTGSRPSRKRAGMISRTNLLLALTIVLTVIAAHTSSGDAPAIKAESIDPLVQPYIDGEFFNAVSIGVVQGDKSWTRHFGTLSKEANQKPSDSTIYEIGSMSKVFTGILLAHAVESGRVQLDQPIGTLMNNLPAANKEVGDSILLRHLATHSSGLPRLPDNMKPADPTNPYADYDRKLLTEFMSRVKPQAKPGEPSGYSKPGGWITRRSFGCGGGHQLRSSATAKHRKSAGDDRYMLDAYCGTAASIGTTTQRRPDV